MLLRRKKEKKRIFDASQFALFSLAFQFFGRTAIQFWSHLSFLSVDLQAVRVVWKCDNCVDA